jgi:hypothetical protein
LPLSPRGIRLIDPIARQNCLDASPNWSDQCDDPNPVKENSMSENAIDSENSKPALDTPKPKGAAQAHQESQAREEGIFSD